MIFRVLYLIALIGLVGRDPGTDGKPVVLVEGEEKRMGGEGFGNFLSLIVLLGVVILAVIVIIAILALAGQFANEFVDPPA